MGSNAMMTRQAVSTNSGGSARAPKAGSGAPHCCDCSRRERPLSRNSDGNECFKWMYLLLESGPDVRTSLLSSQKVQGTTGPLSSGPCQF